MPNKSWAELLSFSVGCKLWKQLPATLSAGIIKVPASTWFGAMQHFVGWSQCSTYNSTNPVPTWRSGGICYTLTEMSDGNWKVCQHIYSTTVGNCCLFWSFSVHISDSCTFITSIKRVKPYYFQWKWEKLSSLFSNLAVLVLSARDCWISSLLQVVDCEVLFGCDWRSCTSKICC